MIAGLKSAAGRIAAAELWFVGVLFVGGMVSARLLPLALALSLCFWPLRVIATAHLTMPTPADIAIAVMILTIPVTLWTTALLEVTWRQVLVLAAGILLYYVVVNWTATESRERVLVFLVFTLGLFLALIAPISVGWFSGVKLTFIPDAIYRALPRLILDAIHPNVMAGALVLLWPIPFALALFDLHGMCIGVRLVTLVTILSMGVILVLSKSRGALLGAVGALAFLCILRWRRGWLIPLIGTIASAAIVLGVGLPSVLNALLATESLGGLDGRIEVWTRAFRMLQDFPLTGIGFGSFRQVANAMYPFFIAGPSPNIPHAHNLLLQVGVDLGLPGLIAWLAVLLLCSVCAWRVYRAGRIGGDRWSAGLGAGLLCSQIALVVHGLLDATVWGTRSSLLVWAVWGLAAAANNLRPNSAIENFPASAAHGD